MAKASGEERRERLARALRANLRRRKAGAAGAAGHKAKPDPDQAAAPEDPAGEALCPREPAR